MKTNKIFLLLIALFSLIAFILCTDYENINRYIITKKGIEKLYEINGNNLVINLRNGKERLFQSHKKDRIVYEARGYFTLGKKQYLILISNVYETDNYVYIWVDIDDGEKFYVEEGNFLISDNHRFLIVYTVSMEFHDGGTFWIYDAGLGNLPQEVYSKKYVYPCAPENFRWITNRKIDFDVKCEYKEVNIVRSTMVLIDNQWINPK